MLDDALGVLLSVPRAGSRGSGRVLPVCLRDRRDRILGIDHPIGRKAA